MDWIIDSVPEVISLLPQQLGFLFGRRQLGQTGRTRREPENNNMIYFV